MDIGDRELSFGMHQGKKLKDVPRDYLRWCVTNVGKTNRDYGFILEYLGMGVANSYVMSIYNRAQIPETDTVKALIRQSIAEGWNTSSTRMILADAMQDADFKEPDSLYSVLNSLRDLKKTVPVRPFFDVLCLPGLRGENAAESFYIAGEPRSTVMCTHNADPWPCSLIRDWANQDARNTSFNRSDVVEFKFDGESDPRKRTRYVKGVYSGLLRDGRVFCAIHQCGMEYCKTCGAVFVGNPYWFDSSRTYTIISLNGPSRLALHTIRKYWTIEGITIRHFGSANITVLTKEMIGGQSRYLEPSDPPADDDEGGL